MMGSFSTMRGFDLSSKASHAQKPQIFMSSSNAARIAPRRALVATKALMGSGPAYNKYKSRRDIEKDYYREWERTTLLGDKEVNRPMSVVTFLTFLPNWFKFYGLPGPLRFVCYLLWTKLSAVGHIIHKKLVIQGAKLDSSLARRAGLPQDVVPRRLILSRFHYRVSPLENIKYRLCLLRGQKYFPKLIATPASQSYASIDSEMEGYDQRVDPWPAS